MMRHIIRLSVLVLLGLWAATPARSASIPIENASFEAPVVDPNNAFGAVPDVNGWTEIDIDPEGLSRSTGVFANTAEVSGDHIVNADGNQLAFLVSQAGNALEQDLEAVYKAGCDYRLTVAVCVSNRAPASDPLDLVLYYRDVNDPNNAVDIATKTVEPTGLSSTLLQDFSVWLPMVNSGDAWAGKTIGVAIRASGAPDIAGGFWDLDNVRLEEFFPANLFIVNASFEAPVVDPNNAFGAVPDVNGWTEIDIDPEGLSRSTGVFANTAEVSGDHIVNADGNQLAFLVSQAGNALEQDLEAVYKAGCDYRLTVAVCVSNRAPASDPLDLVLYYRDVNDPNNAVDIATKTVEPTGLSSTLLQDFSVWLPMVNSGDAWAGKTIGVAIRASGAPDIAGGFWDLDNVRLEEFFPANLFIVNASFEAPVVDPNNAFGAVPDVNGWTEIDIDPEGLSRSTGVFANTAEVSGDHIVNADGNQLAFLVSQAGNALEQDLEAVYKAGCDYRLTVAVCVSNRAPASDPLDLVLYYRDVNDPNNAVDIATKTVEPTGLSSTLLQDFSVWLPMVNSGDAWAGKTIGVAIRASGAPDIAGGFWDLDNVRLAESLPAMVVEE